MPNRLERWERAEIRRLEIRRGLREGDVLGDNLLFYWFMSRNVHLETYRWGLVW